MNDTSKRFRGVGEPAKEKTLPEWPVSERDLDKLGRRIDKEQEELEELQEEGVETFKEEADPTP